FHMNIFLSGSSLRFVCCTLFSFLVYKKETAQGFFPCRFGFHFYFRSCLGAKLNDIAVSGVLFT
ncbi:hypothetical protein M5W86_26330, partial [Paenibacillus thiaminolyticus]|uniref:hypothetical protein n=1 Tax=Paenibacillus thiaminolyticus TaxID=49283 RepID=UPI00227E2302